MQAYEERLLQRVEEFRKFHHTAVLVIMFTDIKGFTQFTNEFGEKESQELRLLHDSLR